MPSLSWPFCERITIELVGVLRMSVHYCSRTESISCWLMSRAQVQVLRSAGGSVFLICGWSENFQGLHLQQGPLVNLHVYAQRCALIIAVGWYRSWAACLDLGDYALDLQVL